MNFYDFLDAIVEMVSARFADEAEIMINDVIKTNDVRLYGLSIKKKGSNVAPTVYMEDYYEEYKNGVLLETIADKIIDSFYKCELPIEGLMDFYCDFDQVKDKLFCKVIDADSSEKLLESVPYMMYLDLAIVAYCVVRDETVGPAYVLVRNDHIKMWGRDAEEVLDIAMKNTKEKMNFSVQPIWNVIKGLVGGSDLSEEISEKMPMFIVTNKDCIYGAIFIAMEDGLLELANKFQNDYYVIPSSVHELIVIEKYEEDVSSINEMISDINSRYVDSDEVLKNHVYLYSRDEQVLKF